jgi:hypothetical protein
VCFGPSTGVFLFLADATACDKGFVARVLQKIRKRDTNREIGSTSVS